MKRNEGSANAVRQERKIPAYEKALDYLSRRDHSVFELKNKLRQKEYPQAEIDAVVVRLLEYGFLNDERFAENYIRGHNRECSKRILCMKLAQKGIPSEVCENAYAAVSDETEEHPEILALRKAMNSELKKAVRKGYCPDSLPEDIKQKMKMGLYRKGFSFSKIEKEFELLTEEYKSCPY